MKLAVHRYESLNVLRSKWIYTYAIFLSISLAGFTYLVADPRKAQLALINVLTLLIPLVSILFTTTYWYNSQTFTELLLAQPVSRPTLFWSRFVAVIASLTGCATVAVAVAALFGGGWDSGILWLLAACAVSGAIFCAFGTLVATAVSDRMWGIGLGLTIWFYFTAVHDALLLLLLYWLRDYSLQILSLVMCALNPLSLLRVALLMHFDAPLLLGHSGAIVRHAVEGGSGYYYAAAVLACWLAVPTLLGLRAFIRRDF